MIIKIVTRKQKLGLKSQERWELRMNMKEKDPEEFFNHTRMDRHIYDLLLSQTKDHLTKKSIRTPINFECRLVSVARSFPSAFGLELSYGKINSQRNNIRDLHNSMGGVFQNSAMGRTLLTGELPLPQENYLPNSDTIFPFFFVADAAFPLKNHIMRPYPGRLLNDRKRVFNYRLSRARRIIENAFGILVARWRILKTTIHYAPDNCEKIVLAYIALHNFIIANKPIYCPVNYVDGEDTDGMVHLG
ncbi:hypothetical protein NQ314_004654 [Rhamnusium bicolor]|uniref:DDE Tnp4 domain-containing protein n=1 Tax=Rhamnusium bicolor TaxID=1586634 RepID=A0AAV8ZJD9_9CUCU|nr:hypothetical protein NQ314_004654 [Rhamnusium bicolor]